jgi:ABC-type Co2+ transport system permease subunit
MLLDSVIDVRETIRRMVKYLIQGLVMALAAYAIPRQSLELDVIASLAIVAAATFSVLDLLMPSVKGVAQLGAAAGIGLSMAGAM